MKLQKIFSLTSAKYFLIAFLILGVAQAIPSVYAQEQVSTCNDGIDNDGDGYADWAGVTANGKTLQADRSCANKNSIEASEVTGTGLVPCYNKCDLNSVFKLINNLIDFLVTKVLLIVIVLMIIYAGFKYITAQGNPAKTANLKKMIWHIIGGLALILCAWLIIKTILVTLGYKEALVFFGS